MCSVKTHHHHHHRKCFLSACFTTPQELSNLQAHQWKYNKTFVINCVLRVKPPVILTILKLDLNLQILSEQVHHHSLHVPSDATAIPFRNKTVFLVSHTKKTLNSLHQELRSVKVTESHWLTSALTAQCSECSWRRPPSPTSCWVWQRGCRGCLQSEKQWMRHWLKA